MARIARFLPLGIGLLGFGFCLLLLALAFEHYGLHRAQFYVGEVAMGAIVIGALGAFVASIARLLPGGDRDD